MNLKDLMGFIFSGAILLPIVLIIVLQLYSFKGYLALSIYYVLGFFDSLMMQNIITVSHDFRRVFGVTYNLLDVPLLLTFLSCFSPSALLSKRIRYTILIFIGFEIFTILYFGFNRNALTITIGPGLSIILFFCIWFFIRQIKIAITHGKSLGKALITSSFLFVYGCYSFIYVMHYIVRTPNTTDVYIMYLVSSALSVIVVSAGIVIENKRIRKLKELIVTRHELHVIYKKSN